VSIARSYDRVHRLILSSATDEDVIELSASATLVRECLDEVLLADRRQKHKKRYPTSQAGVVAIDPKLAAILLGRSGGGSV
jgi:hypothetical protein